MIFDSSKISRIFDLDKDTAITGLDFFRNNKSVDFRIRQGKGEATGSGANRQAHLAIASKVITDGILIQSGYFADINVDHPFWQNKQNIRTFSNFINSLLLARCHLSFHLTPAILEAISNKPMTTSDLSFYADKIDPDAAKLIAECDIHDTGYVSVEEANRTICMRMCNSHQKLAIYDDLGRGLRHIKYRTNKASQVSLIRKIDQCLSGHYRLTYSMVRSIMSFHGSRSQQRMFCELLKSMTESELRAMLLTFGSTTSLNLHYRVSVTDMERDIRISVCFKTIELSSKLFVNQATLQNLKMYFSRADDKISDGDRDRDRNRNHDQQTTNVRCNIIAFFLLVLLVLVAFVFVLVAFRKNIILAADFIHTQFAPVDTHIQELETNRYLKIQDLIRGSIAPRISKFIKEQLKKRIDDEIS